MIELSDQFSLLFRVRLVFTADGLVAPPVAPGAMWRGVLGENLKTQDPDAFQRLFYPSASPGISADNAPSPFVIDPDPLPELVAAPGDQFAVDFTLIGSACNEMPACIAAFENAARKGLGKFRQSAQLIEAGATWTSEPREGPTLPPVPPQPKRAVVVLKSPWVSGAKVTQRNISAAQFLTAVARRVNLICQAHTGYHYLVENSPEVKLLRKQIWFVEQSRWSATRKAEIDASGTLGFFEIEIPSDSRLWNALWWAQWLNIGSHTAYGLGALRVHPI